eukprot:389695-Pyramimonas_sp.AAC.1
MPQKKQFTRLEKNPQGHCGAAAQGGHGRHGSHERRVDQHPGRGRQPGGGGAVGNGEELPEKQVHAQGRSGHPRDGARRRRCVLSAQSRRRG